MTREPVRLLGYPVTVLLVLTATLAALQAADWRGAAIAGIGALIAGGGATEAARSKVTPVADPQLPAPLPEGPVTVTKPD
jgi:hypothetical protein